MNIHSIYGLIFRFTRKRRMRCFEAMMKPTDQDIILDVGGSPFNWQFISQKPRLLLLNVSIPEDAGRYPDRFAFAKGDGRALDHPDAEFGISYSNSVIEHVGSFDDQRRFADEIRRVGKKVWVQTPARCFPIEPHFLTPFIHWLPKTLRKKLLRNCSLWGWLQRPDQDEVDSTVEEIRLLGRAEMRELFPDCEILIERFRFFTKAYIAVRR